MKASYPVSEIYICRDISITFYFIFGWIDFDFWTFLSVERGRLAQMVEGALQKFWRQQDVVQTPPALGFFRVEFKYIPLRRDLPGAG